MVRTHLHNGHFFIKAGLLPIFACASLVLQDFTVAPSGNGVALEGHELRVLHVGVAETSVFDTEGLALAVWQPVIVGLVVPVVLVERVVQVAIHPRKLRDSTEVKRQLSVAARGVLVVLPKRVDLLVEAAVDDFVTQVIVGFGRTFVVDPLRHC